MRVLLMASIVLGVATTAAFGQVGVDAYTVDGGGGRSTSPTFEVIGAIGQADASTEMSNDNFEIIGGFWAGVTPVRILFVSKQSCLVHAEGEVNEAELCLDLDVTNGIECRLGGPRLLRLDAAEDVDPATVMADNVQISCSVQTPSVDVTLEGTRQIVVSLQTPLAAADCCTLTFEGMQSTAGALLGDTLQFTALAGDTNFSGGVTGADASLVKPHIGEVLGIDLVDPQWDINQSGAVTGGDHVLIKPLLGSVPPDCP